MAKSLKNKFFTGLAWTFIQSVGVRAISLIFTIILARLLTPQDYGLIGMLSIFISISNVFIQSGFGRALIQKVDCDDDDFSTAFYFNVGVSLLIYLILFVTAPLIALFFKEPQLVAITRVLSLNFVLGAFNLVQRSKLSKAMNFKPLTIISLVSNVLSGVVGVMMAYNGFGVWALVMQTLSATFIRVLIFPFFTKWHPNRPFSRKSFKQLWGFGSKILVTGILDVVLLNLSNIIIGRFYNKEQVGYFTKARSFAEVPALILSSVLGTVLYPLLSEIQKDKNRTIAIYNRVTYNTIFITFPLMILMMLLAKPIVIILFTEKWLPSVPMLQAFLLARMFLPLNYINSSMLQSAGETKLYMHLYFITGPLSLITVLVSIPFGVLAMAWASVVSGILYCMIFSIVIGRKIGYKFHKQVWGWRKIILSLIIMSIGVLVSTYWISDMVTCLIVGGVVGCILYFTCCYLFGVIDDELKGMIRKIVNK